MSDLEKALLFQISALRLPEPCRNYRFAAIAVGWPAYGNAKERRKAAKTKSLETRLYEAGLRDWQFDFAWPTIKLAVEVEGGTYIRGRHTRPDGYRKDCEKYNAATLMGWRVLRFTSDHITDGYAIQTLEKIL